MQDFATILTRLEEASRSAEPAGGATLASLLGAFARFETTTPKATEDDRAARAARVYGEPSEPDGSAAARKTEERSPRLPEREEFLAELRRAEGSLSNLRALRRRFAWLCHPDRREKAGARQAERLLAEFNAQIDAAVARASGLRRAHASRR